MEIFVIFGSDNYHDTFTLEIAEEWKVNTARQVHARHWKNIFVRPGTVDDYIDFSEGRNLTFNPEVV